MSDGPPDDLAALRDARAYPAWHEVALRYGDQDPNRHINNVAVCQFMEEARVNLRKDRFTSEASSAPAAPVAFVVASFRIRFLRPIVYPGRVRTGTLATRVGSKSYILAHGLFFQDALAAAGRTVTVVCDPQTGRPIAIPPAIAESLASLTTQSAAIREAVETI